MYILQAGGLLFIHLRICRYILLPLLYHSNRYLIPLHHSTNASSSAYLAGSRAFENEMNFTLEIMRYGHAGQPPS
ncbi:hypothetical protein PF007_g28126 [Phytophthora fragariae]|uniref:Uncharacterized protein n=1 Tax=Phytophthora fragariae TaxID=53985 RepID=A0A6A3Q1W0_9STRA|nr:hypothetical protein PF007_g28126 [Phytophthora fragariae]